ncbi:MAG: 23S rRNA (uracil(1939)-C(5))-methyltransferase RlmD [Thermacetogeniaceae bacterium]
MREEKATIETHLTTIEGYSHAGEGVGKHEGKPVFIPFAARGETVRFEITEEKKDFLRGKLTEILEPAPWRVSPPCPAYQNCGGCQLLHLDYEEELYFKQDRVTAALARIGGLKEINISPILKMEEPWRYRHNARFHIRYTSEGVEIGYYQLKSHIIEEIEDCLLLPTDFHHLRKAVADFLSKLRGNRHIPVNQVALRKGWATGELLVQLLADDFPRSVDRESISALAVDFPNLKGLVITIDEIPEIPEMILFGHSYYTEVISEVRFRVPARAFFQNNPIQTEALLRTVSSFLEPQPHEILFDLYCGVGLFAHALAPLVHMVFGIEENQEAVNAARINAELNGNENTEFMEGKVERILPSLERKGIKPDAVILDPPRSGSTPQVLRELCRMSPQKIVYVSCDPATLARDLAIMVKEGYEVEKVQPIDMFPHTYHVECVALLVNTKTGR